MHVSLETMFTFYKFQWPKRRRMSFIEVVARDRRDLSVCLYLDVPEHEKLYPQCGGV